MATFSKFQDKTGFSNQNSIKTSAWTLSFADFSQITLTQERKQCSFIAIEKSDFKYAKR